jgi:hypothetical protein
LAEGREARGSLLLSYSREYPKRENERKRELARRVRGEDPTHPPPPNTLVQKRQQRRGRGHHARVKVWDRVSK